MGKQQATIDFTLEADALDLAVRVRLRRAGDRWVARAVVHDEEHVGLAMSPGRAVAAALAPLGRSAVMVLLADVGLIEPSLRVIAADAAAGR